MAIARADAGADLSHYLAIGGKNASQTLRPPARSGNISRLHLAFLRRLHKSGAIGCPRLLAYPLLLSSPATLLPEIVAPSVVVCAK